MSTETTTAPAFGPRVGRQVSDDATAVYLWSRDLQAAVEAGDVARVADLARVIAEVSTRINTRAVKAVKAAR